MRPTRSSAFRLSRSRPRPLSSASALLTTHRCSSWNSPRRTPLPDDAHIEHHKALHYVEAETDQPADRQFTVDWSADGRSVTVSGPCPACGGRTATQFSVGIGGSKGFRTARDQATRELPSSVTLFCECGHVHEDRPPDAYDRGCGRF